MNDSDSGEDDTARYVVNEKPPSFGRATHQRSQISCLVLGLAGGMGREGCGWGEAGEAPGLALQAFLPRRSGSTDQSQGHPFCPQSTCQDLKKVNKAGLFVSFVVFVVVW